MILAPALRKGVLTLHITAAVGWIGGIIAYLCLVVAARVNQDAQVLHSAWFAMDRIARYGLVPLAVTALLSGLALALGTRWGLFRHYWVVISLILTILATAVLLGQLPQISAHAALAASGDHGAAAAGLREQLAHAGGGLIVLLVVNVLNIYKPRGVTRYGQRRQQEQRRAGE